jgi:hypothetical protein
MQVNYPEKELSLTSFLARDFINGLAELVKRLLTKIRLHENRANCWQLVLLQSEANGRFQYRDDLPYYVWAWPKNTWFQERLSRHLKVREIPAHYARN